MRPRFTRHQSPDGGGTLLVLPPIDVDETDLPARRDDDHELVADGDDAGDGGTSRPGVGSGGLPLPGRRPVVPEWMRNPVETAKWAIQFALHWLAFHSLRVPVYLGRAAWWTPRGLARAVVALLKWAFDAEAAPLRKTAVDVRAINEYLLLDRRRKEKTKTRGPVAGTILVVSLALGYAGLTAGGRTTVLMVLALVLVGGRYGKPEGEPMFEPAVITAPKARRLTTDLVTAALVAAKLGPADEIQYLAAPSRSDGGWRCVVDVAPGKTFADALVKRDAIAGALNAKGVQLILEESEDSERRVILWLADRDPYAAPAQRSPLCRRSSWDIWDGVPFGLNARGKPVVLPLVFTGVLIGSIPRMGKTSALRDILAAVILDPEVRFIPFDGKGGVDLMHAEPSAYRHGAGVRPHTVALLRQTLAELLDDANDRNDRLRSLPSVDCPEGKLTKALARNRNLNMPVTVVFIDEVHRYLEDSVHGKAIVGLLIELAKVAPSVGICLVLSTQRPNAKMMDDGLRGSLGTRFALKTTTRTVSKMILGDVPGYDASKFKRKHRGVGILVGADDGELADEPPQIVRSYYMSVEDFEHVCQAGRAGREAAGTLLGMAAGEQPKLSAEYQLLDDIADTFEPGDDRLRHEEIIERIATAHPERMEQWNPRTFGVAVVALGLQSCQINRGRGDNRRGLKREDVFAALAKRAENEARLALEDEQAQADDDDEASNTA